SIANQARFILERDRLPQAESAAEIGAICDEIDRLLEQEVKLARRLYQIQSHDSRIGFEATNHYFYLPLDLAEKVIACRHLQQRWLHQVRQEGTGGER